MQQGSPSLESFIIKSQTGKSRTTLKKLPPDQFAREFLEGIISKNRSEVSETPNLNLAKVDQFTLLHPDFPVEDLSTQCTYIRPKVRSWYKILSKTDSGQRLVSRGVSDSKLAQRVFYNFFYDFYGELVDCTKTFAVNRREYLKETCQTLNGRKKNAGLSLVTPRFELRFRKSQFESSFHANSVEKLVKLERTMEINSTTARKPKKKAKSDPSPEDIFESKS